MTKTITLIRHLKSNWDDPSLDDFDRPLALRGKSAGPLISSAVSIRCPKPDLILCSPARRTHETLGYILRELTKAGMGNVKVQFEPRIYEATASRLKTIISEVPDSLNNLLLIGHNPAMLDLAWHLSATPDHDMSIYRKFPTGAVASYQLKLKTWKKIEEAKGEALTRFTPKSLKREQEAKDAG